MKRKESKAGYASQVQHVKLLVDRLLNYTDIDFDGKKLVINAQIMKASKLEKMKEIFEDKLRIDLENYDLSDEKLKLATLTKVNIGKFNGSLEKGVDFYTFKTKFLKAYVNHPKSLLVEWLTNNHLEGRAKECVGSLTSIEEVWDRLKSNFGSTEQMLQHQFKKINQLGPMKSQKSFETKMHYLQNLTNTMQDVYDIATEHDLLGELHYGLQLPKIVSLLEAEDQKRWYTIVAEEKLTKPNRWNRMLEFLIGELKIAQVRAAEVVISVSRDEKSVNNDRKPLKNNPDKGGAFHAAELCKLCEGKHPNSNKGFVYCKKFLQMTPKERSNLVRKNKSCLQCIDITTKWNDANHECSNAWVCKDPFHDKYDKRLHFLLCEEHTGSDAQ